MKLRKGQIIEVNGNPAAVIDFTGTMVLVEMEAANGTVRRGIIRDQVAA